MTASLAGALIAAQKEMPAVEPNATNPHFKSKFVTLDHLIAKTRPVLNKHGLAIAQFPAVGDSGLPVLRTVLMHADGEQLAADTPLILGKQDMQQLGAAITYARRFAWASALGISADDDNDGSHLVSQAGADDPAPRAAAVSSGPAAAPPSSGEFRFASGKNEGKTLGEVPRSYLEWYLDKGPREDVKQAIRIWMNLTEQPPLEDDLSF